ncbi:hypothetical protein CPB86DRAFT_740055 [Serendipita vermifera]|nr:hypothetical protein CPB86DRAFT_740055 [Serendipita vermifera]
MVKSKKDTSNMQLGLTIVSNLAIGIACPLLTTALLPGSLTQSSLLELDRTSIALNTSITSFKAIKEATDDLPNVGGPLKATCGVMILVLESIKRCKNNREGWRELAEIIQDKNQRVISLLELYSKAPGKYRDILEQAARYQKILNEIARDMKKETETESEKGSGLERYWERMKLSGREVALSEVNAQMIAVYKERLRDQGISTTEVIGMQMIGDLNRTQTLLMEQAQANAFPLRRMTLKPRPPLVNGFVGRDDILEAMRRIHFESALPRGTTPRVTVLTGLGGSGKTQIALKFALEFEERYEDGSVYFLDASSQASLETDLKILVQSQSDVHTDALVWLANTKRDWLIIMDNADDPSLDLAKFLPRCPHGDVIITTRNHFRKLLAPKSTYLVDSLPLSDSITLLLETSGYEDNEVNRQLSERIAQELGCLPLALAHAGAYIFFRRCLDTYLETYRDSCSHLLERKFDMLHDYPHSVATTIEMSFRKLSTRVQDLLGLLSHLDSGSISRGIIERAANRHFRHVAKETKLPPNTETIVYADVLMRIITPQGHWSSFDFDSLIEECERYSLLRLAIQDEEKFYSMHLLVQTFLRKTCGLVQHHPSRQLVARLLASAITAGDRYEYIAFNRLLLSHLRLVNMADITEAGDHYGFGVVFEEMGEGQLAVSHMERCVEIWRGSLGEDSNDMLAAMSELARSYSTSGKEGSALGLREKVMKKKREVLGDGHLDTLYAMNNLALSYSNLGRDEEALPLNKVVVEKCRRLLGDDHPDTLVVINNLAVSYSRLRRNEEALPLNEEVVKQRRRLLCDDHPDTLQATNNLAILYSNLGRAKEALPLAEDVVKKMTSLLGKEHCYTQRAMGTLAIVYATLGHDEGDSTAMSSIGHTDSGTNLSITGQIYSRQDRRDTWLRQACQSTRKSRVNRGQWTNFEGN